MIDSIYSLRKDFMIIGLTGRTGSGCTTVADILTTEDVSILKSRHKEFREGNITNQDRKDRIVSDFIKKNWFAFQKITASDIIYYFAAMEPFDDFINGIAEATFKVDQLQQEKPKEEQPKYEDFLNKRKQKFNEKFGVFKDSFTKFSEIVKDVNNYLKAEQYKDDGEDADKGLEDCIKLITYGLSGFRKEVEGLIDSTEKGIIPMLLQAWGNNIRKYESVIVRQGSVVKPEASSAIASVINKFIKCIRKYNNKRDGKIPTRIVIDALRNPFEILYFRERYAAFYCMSVNTTEKIRHDQLLKKKNFRLGEVKALDKKEGEKKELNESYQEIDVIRCIQLSDIFLSHNGEEPDKNRDLINQIFTYVALIIHPGLVSPTPQERVMQVAFTAKLNSGCLSRQVGAAVTDSKFSVKSIGWNSVPEGQVPCSLRKLDDLVNREDEEAFSAFERDAEFYDDASSLLNQYSEEKRKNLKGLTLTYCFKNLHAKRYPNQRYNQVHTRSLHAEENAFLQLVKYGGQGIEGGKLFTTASCCELCAKKAYHLGISEIYYIDSYPGISNTHIFQNGIESHRPNVILFSGAVGRAYINLYNPFFSLKDEIEYLTGVEVGKDYNKKDSKAKK